MHTAQEERDQADKQARAARVCRVAEALFTRDYARLTDPGPAAKFCFDRAEAFEREAETRAK